MQLLSNLLFLLTVTSCSKTHLEKINPDQLRKHKSFSQVVKVETGKLVFLSGQVALDSKGILQGTDFGSQLHQSFQNVRAALKSVGSDWDQVAQMRIYVVDLKPEHRFIIGMALDEIYPSGVPPANTLLGIQALARRDLIVEVEVIAVAD